MSVGARRKDARGDVLLGMGANLGRPLDQLREAVGLLTLHVGALVTSSVYRTAPVGYADQPDFLNLVCRASTELSPAEILHACRQVERDLGRTRPFPNAPRAIDVDLLACGDLVLDTPELTLPHPRLHQRAFVLVPLAELDPAWRHPVLGRTAAAMLRAIGTGQAVERLGLLVPAVQPPHGTGG
jgi:2-amino-4-hydroxy-6-hydroxymethyldihydropteridine diphosphokinase